MLEVKIVLVHAVEAYGWNRIVNPHIPNFGDKYRWAVNITAGKESWKSLNRPQSSCEHFEVEKNPFSLPGRGPRVIDPVSSRSTD